MARDPATGRITGRGRKLHPVGSVPGSGKEGLHVLLPVEVEVEMDDEGRVQGARAGEPEPEVVSDAAAYVESLEANRQIAHDPGPLPPGATHQVEKDEEGRSVLKRRRFSAL